MTRDASQLSYGFNTSKTGSRFLRLFSDGSQPGGGTAVFQSARPQRSFGFYVTGVFGDAVSPLSVELDDGETRVFTVPDLPASTAQFWGVLTDGAFLSVKSQLNYPGGGYLIGLDDVQVEAPEPGALLPVLAGLIALTAARVMKTDARQRRAERCRQSLI